MLMMFELRVRGITIVWNEIKKFFLNTVVWQHSKLCEGLCMRRVIVTMVPLDRGALWISLNGGRPVKSWVCALVDLWAQWAHFIRIETVAERNLLGHTCGYSAIYWAVYRLLNTYIDITKHRPATLPDISPPERTTSFQVHIITPGPWSLHFNRCFITIFLITNKSTSEWNHLDLHTKLLPH